MEHIAIEPAADRARDYELTAEPERARPAAPDGEPAPIRVLATAGARGEPIVHDPVMRRLYAMIDLFAPTPLSVLVLGETGVGKELYAGAIHARSQRRARPYLELNCAALPESILEGELFGYERGAFTGAVQAKPGLFEAAHGGTVLLDEIGELPLTTQAKLLRVLESGSVIRLGSVQARRVDVRFVAATNRNLRALVAERKFRADLYFRLNGLTIVLPPLRDRRADIAPLAHAFVARAAAALGRPAPALTPDAIAALERHAWPGNVRELKSAIDRATVFCTRDVLGVPELELADEVFAPRRAPRPDDALLPASTGALVDEMRALGRRRILDALAEAAGNQTRAARALGISRFQLMRRLEDLGVPRPRKTPR